jgi:guanylate kinase
MSSNASKHSGTNMIIVVAPSGAGKSSFVEKICRENQQLVDTVTYTTRSPRAGETPGHPYHFISQDKFKQLLNENFFVEWAKVHTNLYGTPLHQLEDAWKVGKCIIMDVDVQGAETFKGKYPSAKTIFILPPSIDELRRRIVKRDGRVPDDLEVRMNNAEKEMARAHLFDYQVVNDIFEKSYAQFKKIVEDLLG